MNEHKGALKAWYAHRRACPPEPDQMVTVPLSDYERWTARDKDDAMWDETMSKTDEEINQELVAQGLATDATDALKRIAESLLKGTKWVVNLRNPGGDSV